MHLTGVILEAVSVKAFLPWWIQNHSVLVYPTTQSKTLKIVLIMGYFFQFKVYFELVLFDLKWDAQGLQFRVAYPSEAKMPYQPSRALQWSRVDDKSLSLVDSVYCYSIAIWKRYCEVTWYLPGPHQGLCSPLVCFLEDASTLAKVELLNGFESEWEAWTSVLEVDIYRWISAGSVMNSANN